MRKPVVGFILHMEGIRVQSGAPECLFKAIRPCKSLNISQKVLTWPNVRKFTPLDFNRAMVLFLAMGSNFQATYRTLSTKIDVTRF